MKLTLLFNDKNGKPKKINCLEVDSFDPKEIAKLARKKAKEKMVEAKKIDWKVSY